MNNVAQVVNDVKMKDTDAQPHVQYSVGDIIWTKVSGYPWWPCMITTDPELDVHCRSKGNFRFIITMHFSHS